MEKTLLIGGEGYIGNIVSRKLLDNGYFVTSVDNLLYNNHASVLNNIQNKNYSFIHCDMLDSKIIKSNLRQSLFNFVSFLKVR